MTFMMSGFSEIKSAQFRQVTDDQLQEIHNASLEILEKTGVRLHLQEAVDMLKKAGAHVSEGNRVRIPSYLAEKTLNTAPKRVVLCDREGNRVMPLEGRKSFFGTGSDCLNIFDHRNGEIAKLNWMMLLMRLKYVNILKIYTLLCPLSCHGTWPMR